MSLFLMATSLQAQKKMEKRAKKITAEMTEVLDLTKKEAKSVLEVQMFKLKEGKAIRANYEGDERKAELKKLGNKIYNQMKDALGGKEKGKSRLKKWKQHLKNKKQ